MRKFINNILFYFIVFFLVRWFSFGRVCVWVCWKSWGSLRRVGGSWRSMTLLFVLKHHLSPNQWSIDHRSMVKLLDEPSLSRFLWVSIVVLCEFRRCWWWEREISKGIVFSIVFRSLSWCSAILRYCESSKVKTVMTYFSRDSSHVS